MRLVILTVATCFVGSACVEAQMQPMQPMMPLQPMQPMQPFNTGPYATGQNSPKIIDSQGHYRGNLNSNQYDPNSIANPYGRYGSQYSPDSLNNPYGRH